MGDERQEPVSGGRQGRIHTVDIFGRRYNIRSEHDAETIRALAAHVDRRMRQVAQRAEPGDVVGIAVLAALNIADETFQARRAFERREDETIEQTRRLAALLEAAVASVE